MPGAVCYLRVSTSEQASENNSLPAQERKVREYCKTRGIPILKIFVDPGESARTTDRPEFQKMLAYCRDHRKTITHFVVSDLSRLARNVMDQGATLATLRHLGINFVSVDEPITDDSAAGKLAQNMLGSFYQFFSDSLSERTRDRMRAVVKAGRFPWPSPIGYLNDDRKLCVDHERAPLVREAFNLVASGRFTTTDAVLSLVTQMGLTTKRGRPVTKQSFARMLSNPIYAGWIVSGDLRVRGTHDPLVSDEVFQSVRERLNGKGRPHKKVNEDFPLRGVVLCARCRKRLTAGWNRGRKEYYARYWCWTKRCGAVSQRREELESEFVKLLGRMQPTAELLAELPQRAAKQWELRKAQIAANARVLASRLADQETLNQRAIVAKLQREISQQDFETVKKSVGEEIEQIKSEISSLDSEQTTMEELTKDAAAQAVDLVGAWKRGNVNQRQELAMAFFPEGLFFSHERKFFEPSNLVIQQMLWRYIENHEKLGVPDGI